ncbi:MAG: glutathione S-transferase family protein [Candidatus Rickettsia vulgarisii]
MKIKNTITLLALASTLLFQLPAYSQSSNIAEKTTAETIQQDEKSKRTIWGAKISPYVRKVLVTLEEKKIPYTNNEILPTKLLEATKQEVPGDFKKISPFGKIPAYSEIDKKTGKKFGISESDVIMNYLDSSVAANPLRPKDHIENAEVNFMIQYADYTLAPITHKILFEKIVKPKVLNQETDVEAVNKALKTDLPNALDFLEKTLSDNRAWIAGTPDFSLADIAVVSHLATLNTADEKLEDLIGTKRPKLLAYTKKVLARDSFKKALDIK